MVWYELDHIQIINISIIHHLFYYKQLTGHFARIKIHNKSIIPHILTRYLSFVGHPEPVPFRNRQFVATYFIQNRVPPAIFL